jgi:hypothetical protein
MSSTASIQIDRPFRFAIPKDAEKDEAYSNATQEGLIEGDKATARTDDAVDALDSIRRCRKSNCVSSARDDAMAHATVAVLVRNGLPLTRENYLNLNNVDEDDLDAEQESELPQLFQQSMVE